MKEFCRNLDEKAEERNEGDPMTRIPRSKCNMMIFFFLLISIRLIIGYKCGLCYGQSGKNVVRKAHKCQLPMFAMMLTVLLYEARD